MKQIFLLFIFSLFSAVGLAQEAKGTVSGRVTDENNRPVKEADVFFYNGDDIVGSAITGPNGTYITNRMFVGTYKMQTIYGSYKMAWVNNVPVKSGQNTKVNVKLEVKDTDLAKDSVTDYGNSDAGGVPLQSTKK